MKQDLHVNPEKSCKSCLQLLSLTLSDRDYFINRRDVKRFHASVRPFDFEFIDLCRGAQPEVQRHIVLRTIHRAAQNILSLPYRACRHIRNTSNRIARALLRHVANQSQTQPVAIRRRDIAQEDRLRIEIIDHQIKSAITIQIANGQPRPGHAFASALPGGAPTRSNLPFRLRNSSACCA